MVRTLGAYESLPAQRVLAGVGALPAFLRSLTGPPGVLILSRRARLDPVLPESVDFVRSKGWSVVESPPGEPTMESVQEALDPEIERKALGRIVAIGGGGVIDFAKALETFILTPERFRNLDTKRHVRIPSEQRFPQLIAVPTTLGSGAEVSTACVLTRADGVKVYVSGPPLLPQVAILDPTLVAQSPPWVRGMSLLDSLGHALEASMSLLDNEGAALLAKSALQTLLLHGPQGLTTDRTDELLELQWAGHLAGIAQDRLLVGPAHVLAHHFSMVPHGLGVGWFLRGVVQVYATEGGEVEKRFSRVLDEAECSLAGLLSVIDGLIDAVLSTGIFSIHDLAMPQDLEPLITDTAGAASPMPISEENLARIWERLAL